MLLRHSSDADFIFFISIMLTSCYFHIFSPNRFSLPPMDYARSTPTPSRRLPISWLKRRDISSMPSPAAARVAATLMPEVGAVMPRAVCAPRCRSGAQRCLSRVIHAVARQHARLRADGARRQIEFSSATPPIDFTCHIAAPRFLPADAS
jgi:hypothetical protein